MKERKETNMPVRTRFSSKRYNTCVSIVSGIIACMWKEQWSHDRFLDERTKRLFDTREYKSLPDFYKQELIARLRGAVESIFCAGVEWCHFYQGKYISVEEFQKLKVSYREIKCEESSHRWKGSHKLWSGGKT